jgi:SAM-dependent methyltransferase
MNSWQQRYLRKFYSPERGWVDGTTEFHELCRSAIPEGGRILEIGAGPSNRTSRFLASLGELHGVDIDPDAQGNESLVSSHVIRDDRYPVPDASFDVCVSNYVAEHVEQPGDHLREVQRVLKPGGAYVLRTPNALHYVALVSKHTPFWFHKLAANRLRGLGPDRHDPYPTVYAMNTPDRLATLASEVGLQVESLRLVEKEPSYGMSSRALFLAFVAYERLANSTERAGFLRANMFAVLRKPLA